MIKISRISIFFILFYIFFWFFLTFRITQVPPGINGDEAVIGYNAAMIAKTGKDINGNTPPLFVTSYMVGDWKQPMTVYSTVLAFKLFGPSFALLREVSVVFILISATLIFYLSCELLGLKRAGFLSLLIFMTIPAVLIQSHLALENIAPIPFVILWLWMLVKYHKSSKEKYFLLSAFFLGITVFTYPGMRLMLPVFSLMTVVFVWYINRKKRIKGIFIQNLKFILIIGAFLIPLFMVKNQYPGAILSNNRLQNIESYQQFILPYLSSFDPSFLFLKGDATVYHSTGRQGVFLLATLPLFIVGLIKIIQKKNPMLIFILLVFFLAPILYGFINVVYRGSRLLAILPSFTIITTLGLVSILEYKNKLGKMFLVSAALALILLNYLDFVKDYWYEYPNRIRSDFSKPYHIAYQQARDLSEQNNLTVFIQNSLSPHNPIVFAFFEQAYFSSRLNIWSDDQKIPDNSLIIVTDGLLNKDLGLVNKIKVEDTGLGLLISNKK